MTSFGIASFTAVVLAAAAATAAHADCESDLVKLENAYKSPGLSGAATSALDAAKVKAVRALKTDDDKTCHEAVVDGLRQAGLNTK